MHAQDCRRADDDHMQTHRVNAGHSIISVFVSDEVCKPQLIHPACSAIRWPTGNAVTQTLGADKGACCVSLGKQ